MPPPQLWTLGQPAPGAVQIQLHVTNVTPLPDEPRNKTPARHPRKSFPCHRNVQAGPKGVTQLPSAPAPELVSRVGAGGLAPRGCLCCTPTGSAACQDHGARPGPPAAGRVWAGLPRTRHPQSPIYAGGVGSQRGQRELRDGVLSWEPCLCWGAWVKSLPASCLSFLLSASRRNQPASRRAGTGLAEGVGFVTQRKLQAQICPLPHPVRDPPGLQSQALGCPGSADWGAGPRATLTPRAPRASAKGRAWANKQDARQEDQTQGRSAIPDPFISMRPIRTQIDASH